MPGEIQQGEGFFSQLQKSSCNKFLPQTSKAFFSWMFLGGPDPGIYTPSFLSASLFPESEGLIPTWTRYPREKHTKEMPHQRNVSPEERRHWIFESQPSFWVRCCPGPTPGLSPPALSVELGLVSILVLLGAPLHMAMGRWLGAHTPSMGFSPAPR